MPELKLNVTDQGVDLALVGGDLAIDLGLESTIYAALFTDARADDDEIEAGADPRGYFGDRVNARWGSKLWLLERAKRTEATLVRAQQFARDALAWMITDGIASQVDVTASYHPSRFMLLEVKVQRSSDQRWSDLWSAVETMTFPTPGTTVKVFFR